MERAGESAQVPYRTVANLMLAGLLSMRLQVPPFLSRVLRASMYHCFDTFYLVALGNVGHCNLGSLYHCRCRMRLVACTVI